MTAPIVPVCSPPRVVVVGVVQRPLTAAQAGMTAPDRTTWTLVDDGWGDPTIWTDGDHAVATRRGDRIHIDPAFTDQIWQVLTRVFAPDEATLKELDQRIDSYARVLDDPEQVRFCTEDVLSHLSGSGESA